MRPDEKIQTSIMATLLLLGILTAAPIILGDRIVEPFTELGILGPNMKLGDYPRTLEVGEQLNLYLYLGNKEGKLSYYRVDVKHGTQSLNVSDTTPYPGEMIGRYEKLLLNEENTTIPVSLSLSKPGLNQRIVFELYKHSTQSNDFEYDGLWVQLWVNVTMPR